MSDVERIKHTNGYPMKVGTPPQSTVKNRGLALEGSRNHEVGLSVFEKCHAVFSMSHMADIILCIAPVCSKAIMSRMSIWNNSHSRVPELEDRLLSLKCSKAKYERTPEHHNMPCSM